MHWKTFLINYSHLEPRSGQTNCDRQKGSSAIIVYCHGTSTKPVIHQKHILVADAKDENQWQADCTIANQRRLSTSQFQDVEDQNSCLVTDLHKYSTHHGHLKFSVSLYPTNLNGISETELCWIKTWMSKQTSCRCASRAILLAFLDLEL